MIVGEIPVVVREFLDDVREYLNPSVLQRVNRNHLRQLYELLDRNPLVTPLTDMSGIIRYEFPSGAYPIEIIALALACPLYEFNVDNFSWNKFDERFYASLWRLIDSIDLRLSNEHHNWNMILRGRSSTGYLSSRHVYGLTREKFGRLKLEDIALLRGSGSPVPIPEAEGRLGAYEELVVRQSTMGMTH